MSLAFKSLLIMPPNVSRLRNLKCMMVGTRVFRPSEPSEHTMCNTSIVGILGASFDQMGNSLCHVDARSNVCRRSVNG